MKKIGILFFIAMLSISVYSQSSRTHRLYSRNLALVEKNESTIPPKKCTLKILSIKTGKPIPFADIYIEDLGLEFSANENGIVSFELPANLFTNTLVLEIDKNRYFSKTIEVNVEGKYEINKTIQLRYNKRLCCFRSIICPSF